MDHSIPDFSYGDYYCRICDSHMTSLLTFKTHIIGKRHLKNVAIGSPESKYEKVMGPSSLEYELKYAKGPVVGLSFIHEIRRQEKHASPFFNCFMCQAILPTPIYVVEHVTSMKHKHNYLRETCASKYSTIMATHMSKEYIAPLIDEACCESEKILGRGSVTVKIEKREKKEIYKDVMVKKEKYKDVMVKKEKPEDVMVKIEKPKDIIPASWKSAIENHILPKTDSKIIKSSSKKKSHSQSKPYTRKTGTPKTPKTEKKDFDIKSFYEELNGVPNVIFLKIAVEKMETLTEEEVEFDPLLELLAKGCEILQKAIVLPSSPLSITDDSTTPEFSPGPSTSGYSDTS